jgi:multicomponent K+:H+ antiporter subunit C
VSAVLLALAVGVFAGCGVWLCLRSRAFDVALGLTLLSYAINLIIVAAGGTGALRPPILVPGRPATLADTADPLPQALVLPAIVISFAMTAVVLALALRSRGDGADGATDDEDADRDDRASPAGSRDGASDR